jgi:hypothetical protein
MVRSSSRPTPRRTQQRSSSNASQLLRDFPSQSMSRSPRRIGNNGNPVRRIPELVVPRSPAPTPLKGRSLRSSLKAMPNRMPLPVWLRALKKIERISITVTLLLVGSAVATYGWAVYSQQLWGKDYSRLDTLRRNERQLLKGSELMKNDIARRTDPKQYGLVPRSSDHIVVMPPAPLRPAPSTHNLGPDPKAKLITPIGY